MRYSLVATFFLVACGGGDDGGGGVDSGADGPAQATVVAVDPCPATPDAVVMTENTSFSYMPAATTIGQGQVVQFITSTEHDVKPSSSKPSDPGLLVGFNKTACLRFTATGTFTFVCSIHGFSGTVTVN